MKENTNQQTGEGKATHVVNDRLVRARSFKDSQKLLCTKAPIPYVEALAKERGQLRAKLNQVTAQRDELLEACRFALAFAINAPSSRLEMVLRAAIATVEGSQS